MLRERESLLDQTCGSDKRKFKTWGAKKTSSVSLQQKFENDKTTKKPLLGVDKHSNTKVLKISELSIMLINSIKVALIR